MSYGPDPWQQTHWDWRAAGNFIGGGAGSGLIALAPFSGAEGPWLAAAMLAGVALIGLGLLCVWAEIGRPLRALNVFFNPHTSWMTREALVGSALVPVALAAAVGAWFGSAWALAVWPAAALALAFVYCQGRILRAARGIPTWREPMIVPLVVLTGLAEGAGLWMLLQPLQLAARPGLLTGLAALLLARAVVWPLYRRRLARGSSAKARAVLDQAGLALLWAGAVLPLTALAIAPMGWLAPQATAALLMFSGLAATAAGSWFKFALITRAAFNQGFALVHLPVRGVRR